MLLREKSSKTSEDVFTKTDREAINRKLISGEMTALNYLCVGKVAQHRDEARILLAHALSNPIVLREIEKQAKSLIDKGIIGFGYEQPNHYYKNVNFDEEKSNELIKTRN